MNDKDQFDFAWRTARTTLGLMERHAVPPHPANFTVWYTYITGRMPDLVSAIDTMLKDAQPFSAETNAVLFERFFGHHPEEVELRRIGQRIEEAAGRVIDHLAAANRGAVMYGAALDSFSGELDRVAPAADLSTLVHGVVSETRRMVEINNQLEERLASASYEVSRLREDIDELRREATVDHLTGLGNRKLFDITLREAQIEADLDGGPLSLLMIDIDHFKKFNDTHGHLLGDQVLKLVGRTLVDCVRGNDTAARYGGEEFGVVLPGTPLADAIKVAENIRRTVADKSVVNRRSGQVLGRVTLSVGTAQHRNGESSATLIHRADQALYSAKRSGRNRVVGEGEVDGAPP